MAFNCIPEVGTITENEDDQWIKGLTMSQRIQGFLLFMTIAFFASFMSWIALGMGHFWKYTFLSSIGTLLSLASTFILMGPSAQFQYMMEEHRRMASIMYIGSVVLSIFVAIIFQSTFLCILTTAVQYACLGWYTLTYIPYGGEVVMSFFS